jgi:hypothetical protein
MSMIIGATLIDVHKIEYHAICMHKKINGSNFMILPPRLTTIE